jgi:hypothetical protein
VRGNPPFEKKCAFLIRVGLPLLDAEYARLPEILTAQACYHAELDQVWRDIVAARYQEMDAIGTGRFTVGEPVTPPLPRGR